MEKRQSFLDTLKAEFKRPPLVIGPKETIRVEPKQPLQVAPKQVVIVQPPARGLWNERGWTCTGSNGMKYFQGYYQACRRRDRQRFTWPGRIIVRGTEVTLYIADPPTDLNRHPKGVCFQREEGRWFCLHWHHPARNVDDAILYMERILNEVVNDP